MVPARPGVAVDRDRVQHGGRDTYNPWYVHQWELVLAIVWRQGSVMLW